MKHIIKRVQTAHDELVLQADKLETYLNHTPKAAPRQITLMWAQLDHMRVYQHILKRRLEELEEF